MLEDCDVIVMREAGNKVGSVGCEHISSALRELTGLQELDLGGTCLHDCVFCGACGVNSGSCQKYGISFVVCVQVFSRHDTFTQ